MHLNDKQVYHVLHYWNCYIVQNKLIKGITEREVGRITYETLHSQILP